MAARYSDLDLNYHDCGAGHAIPAAAAPCFDAVRGGEQKISTVGLNWYLNPAIRFMFDYLHVDMDRFNAAGQQVGQKYNAIAMRSQLDLLSGSPLQLQRREPSAAAFFRRGSPQGSPQAEGVSLFAWRFARVEPPRRFAHSPGGSRPTAAGCASPGTAGRSGSPRR